MEAPLNKKANKLRQQFNPVWAEVGAYLLYLSGFGDVPVSEITPVWSPVESIQPKTQAEIRTENIKSGLALTTALRLEGRSADEIGQMMHEKQEAQEQETSVGDAVLNSVLARTAQINPNQGTVPNGKKLGKSRNTATEKHDEVGFFRIGAAGNVRLFLVGAEDPVVLRRRALDREPLFPPAHDGRVFGKEAVTADIHPVPVVNDRSGNPADSVGGF